MKRKGKGLRILAWVAGVLAALLVLPYAYPLSAYTPEKAGALADGGRLVDVDGTAVYVRTYLPETRGPDGTLYSMALRGRILLVHGFGGSGANWDAVAPALAEAGFAVAAADVPGFGYSDKRIDAATYSHARNAATLWRLTEILAAQQAVFDGPWILAGHSMGGTIVSRMALQEAERIERVVLVDGAVHAAESGKPGAQGGLGTSLSFPPAGRAAADVLDLLLRFPGSVRGMLASAMGRAPTDEELASYAAPLRVPGTARALLAIARSGAGGVPPDLEERLRATGVRVALIWGTEDAWIPISSGESLAETFGVPLHRIAGAGHLPMQSHPAAFLDAFEEGLQEGAAP